MSAQADPDGDGVANVAEISARTDPFDDDTDGDGTPDGVDNCPLLSNYSQDDSVHPGGGGDRCDDPDGDRIPDEWDGCPDAFDPDQRDSDGDGVPDACNDPLDADGDGWADGRDNCIDVPNPDQTDGDGDGIGDACDPFPQRALVASPDLPTHAVAGMPALVTFVVRDRFGNLVPEAGSIRMTLRTNGSATFANAPGRGGILTGTGTQEVFVQFEDGVLDLEIFDPISEAVRLVGEDTDRVGIVVDRTVFSDFEADEAGFTYSDAWQWGPIASEQGGAHSGANAWSTNLAATPYHGCTGILYSPRYAIEPGKTVLIGFWRLISFRIANAILLIRTDAADSWTRIGTLGGPTSWENMVFEVEDPQGTWLQFSIVSIGYCEGPSDAFNVDDVLVRGLSTRLTFEPY